jgi:hypothetical protein
VQPLANHIGVDDCSGNNEQCFAKLLINFNMSNKSESALRLVCSAKTTGIILWITSFR